MAVYARNLVGTSDEKCSRTDHPWKDHHSDGAFPTKVEQVCHRVGCNEIITDNIIGAHVEQHGVEGRFIILLCKGCNGVDQVEWFPVKAGTIFVPVEDGCAVKLKALADFIRRKQAERGREALLADQLKRQMAANNDPAVPEAIRAYFGGRGAT